MRRLTAEDWKRLLMGVGVISMHNGGENVQTTALGIARLDFS